MSISDLLVRNINESINAKQQMLLDQNLIQAFSDAVAVVIKSYKTGGLLYIAGNSGFAADAQHLAVEFVSKLARDRGPLPAEALTVDTSIIMAIGNGYGYDLIFSRQILGKAQSKDVFLGITTPGNLQILLKP